MNVFIVSASGSQKSQFWAKFDIVGSCTDPLLRMTAKFSAVEQTHDMRLLAKFRLDRFILSPRCGEKPQFCRFLEFGI